MTTESGQRAAARKTGKRRYRGGTEEIGSASAVRWRSRGGWNGYWHDLGYKAARFWAEPIPERFAKVGTYEIYRVACNLVNGLPPRYLDEAVKP